MAGIGSENPSIKKEQSLEGSHDQLSGRIRYFVPIRTPIGREKEWQRTFASLLDRNGSCKHLQENARPYLSQTNKQANKKQF